jgi:hypothetical protein
VRLDAGPMQIQLWEGAVLRCAGAARQPECPRAGVSVNLLLRSVRGSILGGVAAVSTVDGRYKRISCRRQILYPCFWNFSATKASDVHGRQNTC